MSCLVFSMVEVYIRKFVLYVQSQPVLPAIALTRTSKRRAVISDSTNIEPLQLAGCRWHEAAIDYEL